jgi:hypothetical protein
MQNLKTSQFRIKYRKQSSQPVNYTQLVALIKEKGPFVEDLRLNNPVGENRTRQLEGDEMLTLWQDVARTPTPAP